MLGFLVLNKRTGREGWCHYVTTTLSGVLVQIPGRYTLTTHAPHTDQKEKRGAHVMVVASRVERAVPSFATS